MTILDLVKRSGRWALVTGGLLLAAEATARIEDRLTWGAPLTARFSEDRLTVRDSLGNHGRAGYQFKKWRMNNLGFRGPDMTPLPASATRVALLGASETFGLFESVGKEYAVQLQGMLDSAAPGTYEIVNTGLPGLSLSSMVPYYRNIVAPTQPAYVLVYPSPSFYLEVNPLPPVYVVPKTVRPAPEQGLVLRFPSRAKEAFKAMIPSRAISAYRAWSLTRQRALHPADWVWSTVPAERVDLMRQHVRMLVDSIQATGARAVLVTHTNRFVGAAADTLTADRRRLIDLSSLYYPRASMTTMVAVDSVANQVMREVAAEKGAGVIEVERRIPPTSGNFADYAHFTDAGAAVMARLLTEGILHLGPRVMEPPAPIAPDTTRH